jgi:hypothetical protein
MRQSCVSGPSEWEKGQNGPPSQAGASGSGTISHDVNLDLSRLHQNRSVTDSIPSYLISSQCEPCTMVSSTDFWRDCAWSSCTSIVLRTIRNVTQSAHDIRMAIQTLSRQHSNTGETSGRAPNHPVDGLNWTVNRCRLHLSRTFLGTVALFSVGRTLSPANGGEWRRP